MKTLICYASLHHGNTKKIAEVMAKALNADLVTLNDLKPDSVMDYDLAGFGSGIYFSRHFEGLLKKVEALPSVQGKRAFVFSTAGFPAAKPVSHHALKSRLAAKGFDILDEFSCRGFDTYGVFGTMGGMNAGHPDEQDIDAAKKFAKRLVKKVKISTALADEVS